MTWNKMLIQRCALAILVVVGGAATAWAQGVGVGGQGLRRRPPGGMGQFGEWWNNPETVEQLGLDEGIRGEIDDLVYQTQQKMIDLRAGVEKENLELRRMLESKDPQPMPQIEAQVDRFVTAQGSVNKEEIMLRARIMSLLTPDQRTQLEELHAERRREMRERALSRPRGPRPSPGTPDEPPQPPQP